MNMQTVSAGYGQFLSDSGERHGSFEVFWLESPDPSETGWYWHPCWPGCLPDGDVPSGPFATAHEARQDACNG